jgi:formate hydrogenlyase transcriptional activator
MDHQWLMELAVSAVPCGIVVVDMAGTILFANPALHAMFGYEVGTLTGVSIDKLVPDALARRSTSLREELWREPPARQMTLRSVEAQRKDGTVLHVEVSPSPSMSDGDPFVLASVVDCTHRDALETELFTRQEFERALADIAAGFLSTPDEEIDAHIADSQRQLAMLLDVERSTLWQTDDAGDLRYTHLWLSDQSIRMPPPGELSAAEWFPWTTARMHEGQTVAFASLDEVPDPVDRASYARLGTRSGVFVPLTSGGQLLGALAFSARSAEQEWAPYAKGRLHLIASVFAHALARRASGQALGKMYVEVQRLRDQLAVENVQLRKEVHTLKGPRVLATESASARSVLEQVHQVAPTTASVLLLGETGSGKEVFAEALHEASPRRQRRMVRVNCAAIPSALIESELFGRERGAYTGAISRQLGRFELADQSTIFLDEIGDLPLDVQVKLLRVLQDHVIERLGSPQQIKIDVRVVAATNRDLEQAVADRTFREDLFYRLNVFPIQVPPLRERVEDIPTLVWSFINEFSVSFGKNIESLSKASLHALQAYAWPGNVRELRNVVERAVILSTGPQLVIEPPRPLLPAARRRSMRFVDVEIEHLRTVLDSTGWRIRGGGGAADVLGIKPTTLESRMAKLGISRSSKVASESTGRQAVSPASQRQDQDD